MPTNFIAGSYQNSGDHKAFHPNLINKLFVWSDPQINVLLEEAMRYLAELNAYSLLIPDVDFFISMHISKEAITSSRIEGTQTNLREVFLPQEEIDPERQDDWNEVQNYIQAMNYAIDELQRLPFSMRLLRGAHKILLKGVRGKHKQPGEVRTSQNWIGGSTLRDAVFVPPPPEDLGELLSDLEHFLHNNKIHIPLLIRIAIGHYQFETIHPFLDGNGRIGRLMITLYLVSKGILQKPTLYLSDFFATHRTQYYDALMYARTTNAIEHWIKFFLEGVSQTAQKGKVTFEKVITLRKECEEKIIHLGKRARSGQILLKKLYTQPTMNIAHIAKTLDISIPSSTALVRSFEKLGILKEATGFKRNKQYSFRSYLSLFEK